MHGICFDYPLQDWFDFTIPDTKIPSDYIVSCLKKEIDFNIKPSAKIIWMGGMPRCETFTKSKKGNSWQMMKLTFHAKLETFDITIEEDKAQWLIKTLETISVCNDNKLTFIQLKSDFENHFEDFELFWYSKPINTLRDFGLLIL
jgi:acyl carrier protein